MVRDLIPRRKGYLPSILDDSRDFFKSFDDSFKSIFSDDRAIGEDGTIVYSIEVPGFAKEDITVELSDGILTIKGKIKDKMVAGVNIGDKELYRRMTVSSAEGVEPVLENGVLYLVLKPAQKESTKIEIK